MPKYKLLTPIEGITITEFTTKDDESVINKVSIQILIDQGYLEEVKEDVKWEPKIGDNVHLLFSSGDISEAMQFIETLRGHNLLGFYKTYEEAEQARDKIRAFVQNGFKSV